MSALSISKPYAALLRDKRRVLSSGSPVSEWLAVIQGTYYGLMGLWPIVSLRSFQKISGPVIDIGSVKTVGVLLCVIGIVLILAAVRSVLTIELGFLMIGGALGFGAIDLIYFARGIHSSLHLFDACEEITMLILSLFYLSAFTHRRHSTFV